MPAMSKQGRIYRRTDAGRKAWDTQDTRVPVDDRRVLGLITTDVHTDELRSRLSRFSVEALNEILADLELRGLVESKPEAAEADLDFTTEMNLGEIMAAARKKAD